MGKLEKALEENCVNYIIPELDEGENYPLSSKDAEIIRNIVGCLKEIKQAKDLVNILNDYKSVPDNEILFQLTSFCESYTPDNNKKGIQPYVEIGDSTIQVSALYSFTKVKRYLGGVVVNMIIVNKSNNDKIPYANFEVIYPNEEILEQEYSRIKEKLSEFTNIIFL